jgi:hypothetical protein
MPTILYCLDDVSSQIPTRGQHLAIDISILNGLLLVIWRKDLLRAKACQLTFGFRFACYKTVNDNPIVIGVTFCQKDDTQSLLALQAVITAWNQQLSKFSILGGQLFYINQLYDLWNTEVHIRVHKIFQ